MKKELLVYIAAGFISLCASAAEYELIDFKALGSKNGVALDEAAILESVAGTEGMVKSISCVNTRYATGSNLAGIWFDSPSEDNEGSITIEINPSRYVKATRINFYGSKAKDLIGQSSDTPVVFSVNGKSSTGIFSNKTPSAVAAVSQTLDNEIVKTITFSLPYDANNPYNEYSGCLQSVRIYYEPVEEDAREEVSEWKFDAASHTGYLDREYTMPALLAIPSVAAEMAEYSSSDEGVASFEEGRMKLHAVGTTTVTASLGSNMLFRPLAASASYTLTVEQSGVSTLCQELFADSVQGENVIYDLNGQTVSEPLAAGIYVMKNADGTYRKILVK